MINFIRKKLEINIKIFLLLITDGIGHVFYNGDCASKVQDMAKERGLLKIYKTA